MKLILASLMFSVTTPLRADVHTLTEALLETATQKTLVHVSAVESLVPHYLVYAFEVSKSTGLGDVAEVEGSFGVEFHFEKVEAP